MKKSASSSSKSRLEKFRSWIQKDPTKLIRYIVLLICCIVVIVQLLECFLKLNQPPISTHSHYDLNDTMYLPAVTICRDPPYKPKVLKQYNLSEHPKYKNGWNKFPFETANLTKMFYDATYRQEEILWQHALSAKPENVDITSSLHFTLGMCYTFRAAIATRSSFRDHGYTILLKHDTTKEDAEIFSKKVGWHVYIHEAKENFTEIRMKSSGRVEYMYLDVEEEVEIKLQSQLFNMMTDGERQCSNVQGYSAAKCGELCTWNLLTGIYNCSGPWMPDIDLPYCNNYSSMTDIIKDYGVFFDETQEPSCNCPDPCQSTIYSAFVMNRKELKLQLPATQLWLYYTSKLVTIVEERPSYDLSQFVADIGGSIGFLLGLSVLGFIEIIEKIASIILLSIVKKRKEGSEKDDGIRRSSFTDDKSDSTVEISTITKGQDYKNV